MDTINLSGRLTATTALEDGGTTVNHYTNNIMTSGKLVLARFIAGQNPSHPGYMAAGTDSTPPNPSQTQLFSEVFRRQVAFTVIEGTKTKIDCVFGQGEAIGELREVGLFTADGIMFARANIQESKGIYQDLTISWEITIS